eukprot:4890316-Alexandrium_andersonii.AAC.1
MTATSTRAAPTHRRRPTSSLPTSPASSTPTRRRSGPTARTSTELSNCLVAESLATSALGRASDARLQRRGVRLQRGGKKRCL